MRKGEKIWPLVQVNLDAKNPSKRNIYNLTQLGGLNIKVEAKRKSKIIPQCRRCLKFRHTSNYCSDNWACAFCAKNHATATCTIKDNPNKSPICFNCRGPHRANYRGCIKAPQKATTVPQTHNQAIPPLMQQRARVPPLQSTITYPPLTQRNSAPRSYAQSAANAPLPPPLTSPNASQTAISDPFQNPAVMNLFRDFAMQLARAFQPSASQPGASQPNYF